MDPMSEQLWDVNDVAEYLKVSRSWVYHRVAAGLLPCTRIGALVRFRASRGPLMASVYSKSGKWYLRYKDAGGRWVDRVTQAETKTEAKRLSGEVQRKVERHRLGIAESPSDCRLTLTELCDWWLKNRCPPAREYNERKRLQRHVLASPLGRTPIRFVSAGLIENQLRRMEEQNLSAATINGLRGTLGTVFNRARKAGIWTGPNPIQDVESRREPKKVRATLRAEEVSVLLPHVPRDWQALFATALLTGMRKGELFGLKKSDVDLQNRMLLVARSYDKPTTKGGHADIVPISQPLIQVLEGAIQESSSEYVFPDRNGRMRSPAADPQKVLRHAMARAGLVVCYDHICRRCKAKGAPHVEQHQDGQLRTCSACGMKLWPKAIPRAMRFHDLRHYADRRIMPNVAPRSVEMSLLESA